MNSPGRSPPCKQPEPGHGSSCRVAETPSKHEENGGFRYSNINKIRVEPAPPSDQMTKALKMTMAFMGPMWKHAA